MEFVLEIQPEAIERYRLVRALREVELGGAGNLVIRESKQRSTYCWIDRQLRRGKIANVISPEIYAHFERVVSPGNREIIHQSPLGHVASLREKEAIRKSALPCPEAQVCQ
jgi:hypothetical protein